MKTGKVTIVNDIETCEMDDIIFRSQDGKTELSFDEWIQELDIDVIFCKTRLDEDE